MRTILLGLIFTATGWGIAYTHNCGTTPCTGDWNTPTQWTPNGVPGFGDTVVIPDGMQVNKTGAPGGIGTGSGNGTVAVTLNNSGRLAIIQSGMTFRGDVVYTPNSCANTSPAIYLGASTWTFDSTTSSSPTTTHYTFRPNGPFGCRPFQIIYTGPNSLNPGAYQYSTITSNTTGGAGAGYFSANGSTINGGFILDYTHVDHIGDATHPAFEVGFHNSGDEVTWHATYSTFDHCGLISDVDATTGIFSTSTFIHSYNIHTNSMGGEIFGQWLNTVAKTTGTRILRNNQFDVPPSIPTHSFGLIGFDVWGNQIPDANYMNGAWESFQGNLVRCVDWGGGSCAQLSAGATMSNSYLFVDTDQYNPHVTSGSGTLDGVIFGQGGNAMVPTQDSGELGNGVTQIYNSIMLPNMAGHSSLEMCSMLPGPPSQTLIAEHNTWFGGYTASTTGPGNDGANVWPTVNLGEGTCNPTTCPAGSVTSFKSNILWNPELTGYKSSFFKVLDVSHAGSPVADYCAPADCDYNLGYNHTLISSGDSSYTNQGNGYAAKFSVTPGAHDLECVVASCSPSGVNPMFVDYQRSLELFDGKYLGYNPAAWSSGGTYSIGDMVQTSQASVYWSLPVNYRYTNGATCSSANPQPGSGSNWRSCWEWASLYHIRQAMAVSNQWDGNTAQVCPNLGVWDTRSGVGQCLWDDVSIGAHGVDIIMTMIQWIRAGYTPTNTLLAGAAHDGTDIGAVPVGFGASAPPPPPTTTSLMTSGTVTFSGKVVVQ